MITTEFKINALRASGIVVVSKDWSESKNGLVETTTEEILCIRNEEYRRIRVVWTEKFLKDGDDYSILSDEMISAVEYRKALKQHGAEDKPEHHARLERQTEISAELKKMQPRCSECKALMVFRTGKYGGFWGCRRFPSCNGKKNPKPHEVKRITGLLAEYGPPFPW